MEIAITVIISFGITWWFLYEYLYSPKAQIKRYWKEIFEITATIAKIRNAGKDAEGNEVYPIDLSGLEQQVEKKKRIINALLEHYFDSEEDQEYIEENRP